MGKTKSDKVRLSQFSIIDVYPEAQPLVELALSMGVKVELVAISTNTLKCKLEHLQGGIGRTPRDFWYAEVLQKYFGSGEVVLF